MAQRALSFQYEAEETQECTAFGGLPLYFELATVSGIVESIERHLRVKQAGWEDVSIVLTIVLLNLIGGERVEDVKLMENDPGLRRIMYQARLGYLKRHERRAVKREWERAERRGEHRRAFPSPDAVLDYLKRFHDPATEERRLLVLRERGIKAFIPEETAALKALWRVMEEHLGFLHHHQPVPTATLDMDATLVESHKAAAKPCYKGFLAYQPLNVYWHELDAIVYSEFRDGNVPASYGLLEVLKRALGMLPEGVDRVLLRSDTAGYDWQLLHYCARGMHERFGRIDFAVGADVTQALKAEVATLKDKRWKRLYKTIDGVSFATPHEYAEVCFVPTGAAHSKQGPEYRFIVTREPLQQRLALGDAPPKEELQQKLPFPTMDMTDDRGNTSPYKLHALVTTLDWEASQVIWWLRGRCGKSEEVHAVMKHDLAGGIMPCAEFGANAAWWTFMLLALNLSNAMKRLVLGPDHAPRRLKSIRLVLINIAGRLVHHARALAIKIARPAFELLKKARETIWSLARGAPCPGTE